MHPDCGNKGSHDDFIKLNEAYSVLSKKDTKHYYDIEVKYNDSVNCDFHSHRYIYKMNIYLKKLKQLMSFFYKLFYF